jgi:hypothetical protein
LIEIRRPTQEPWWRIDSSLHSSSSSNSTAAGVTGRDHCFFSRRDRVNEMRLRLMQFVSSKEADLLNSFARQILMIVMFYVQKFLVMYAITRGRIAK